MKRPHYIAFGLVVVLTLIVLNLPSQTAAKLKLAIGGLFLPLFGLAAATQNATTQAADALTPRAELLRQNEQLRRENGELRNRQLQTDAAARENDRLRQLLGWQKQTPWKLKLAHVVLREPANWWRTVQIDLGSRDGVRTNLAVLLPEGLVGRVATVAPDHSQVVLLGDPACRVSVLVENDTRDLGVIGAAPGPVDHARVTLAFLPPSSALKPGQNVVTSGQGGIFPKGIPVGRIEDFRAAETGSDREARVKLGVNLAALEEVWVLFP